NIHNLDISTMSDTEVVLKMYIKYGTKCLDYFNGMFAFVIYNENNGDVFVARDRLGIKPLYYANHNGSIIFSSEIAPIQNIVNSDFDDFGIRQYRKFRMTFKGYTIYKQIKMFDAGNYWLNGKFNRYWDLKVHPNDPPGNEELKSLIIDSVRIRKRSDVSVGSYLSGGLDSTILTYLLKPNDTWTVGFDELNEFKWSDIADSNLKSQHHKIKVEKKEFIETLKWMIGKRKEPLSVPNEVLIYLMTLKVKSKNTVILSGEGADELFWGYDRIFKWANSSKNLDLKMFEKYYCYGSNNDDEVIDYALENLPGDKVIDKIGYFFQIYHLHGLLRRLDNSTMLCSVEARVPFVDHRLVERLGGVPFNWRMGKTFKEPLKKVFKDIIPREIIERPKVGFPVPLENIFNRSKEKNLKPMDSWLLFNLNELNIDCT
ncbi:asparagine synthase (glutamine-hydrolyzing), partial [Candidatus Marinimicrobia bacterium]|nr:asparagine synthase (glutamine-hydrolyzing) [Candidatus Neomarinimicrobiota bacterium]